MPAKGSGPTFGPSMLQGKIHSPDRVVIDSRDDSRLTISELYEAYIKRRIHVRGPKSRGYKFEDGARVRFSDLLRIIDHGNPCPAYLAAEAELQPNL